MRRFLISHEDVGKTELRLSTDESHHITTVLKLTEGNEIELFDGRGTLLQGRIEQTGKNVLVRVLSRCRPEVPNGGPLYLFQADLKAKKMDFIIQKAVELGVERVYPFTSSRSQGRVSSERKKRKLERWQKLIETACKQSLRLTLMECEEEMPMASVLHPDALEFSGPRLLFWEGEQQVRLSDIEWDKSREGACVMLGPEGGFSEEEIEMARHAGWQTVSLGEQILRAETATIAVLSIVQFRLGKM